MDTDRLTQLEQRLRKTQRRLQLLLGIVALMGLWIVGRSILPTAHAQDEKEDVPAVVAAQAFHLQDEQGEIRAVLGFRDREPGLTFYDIDERSRMELFLFEDDAELIFRDQSGHTRTKLLKGRVVFEEPGKQPRAALGTWKGRAMFQLVDGEGKTFKEFKQ